MCQILVNIPIWLPHFGWQTVPLYGYGMMLFLAYVFCTWLGGRLARRVGIDPFVFKDLTIWLFISGILGARIWHFVFEVEGPRTIWQFFAFWDGGLIFYGSIFGALIGFYFADRHLHRIYQYDRWKLADCVAPCIALGLALGRFGCLLNGCCFGNVACEKCPAITFPLASPPRFAMVARGYQTTAGFTLDRDMQRRVEFVEPGSEAEAAGLKTGDVIVKVNDKDVIPAEGPDTFFMLHMAFGGAWPRGESRLTLTVESPEGVRRDVGPIAPRTLGVHPTQIYEVVSATLLLFFLVSYFPYRHADGELMVIFMFAYGVHRFINEMLRSDNEIVAFNMTLSQNISILVILGAAALGVAVYRHAKAVKSVG